MVLRECLTLSYHLTLTGSGSQNSQRDGGGANGPPGFKNLISLEPKVGLTSNQAVNLSLSVVKIFVSLEHEGILEGPYLSRVP